MNINTSPQTQFEVKQQGQVKGMYRWATVKCYFCSASLLLFPTGAFFRIKLFIWLKVQPIPVPYSYIYGSCTASWLSLSFAFFFFNMLMINQFMQESITCIPLKWAQASRCPPVHICTCQCIIYLQCRALRKETQTDGVQNWCQKPSMMHCKKETATATYILQSLPFSINSCLH